MVLDGFMLVPPCEVVADGTGLRLGAVDLSKIMGPDQAPWVCGVYELPVIRVTAQRDRAWLAGAGVKGELQLTAAQAAQLLGIVRHERTAALAATGRYGGRSGCARLG